MADPNAPRPKTLGLDADLHQYLVAHGSPPDAVLERLAADTLAMGQIARMQIAPEQGSLLTMLAKMLGATLIVEVGTFTGYSSVCLARGLADGGRLICCDVSAEYTARAVQAWAEAGLTDRVDLRIAPGAETLRALPHDPPIDMAFIDADKSGYATYYEEIISRTRPGGLIAVDNVLWGGSIIDPSDTSKDTLALREFNDMVLADDRVDVVMLPIADGLTLCRRR
ncbi:MAG: caffeoyl O-methyltransferase match [Acidimicrobiales bacterium]|jgi:caffeoyl-CoA O-methyltransferase|nr:caffeoyl O-methyltransferase match [Acidimicrobiales bacterium]